MIHRRRSILLNLGRGAGRTARSSSCLIAGWLTLAALALPVRAQSSARAVPPQPAGELGTYAAMGSGVAWSLGIGGEHWTEAQFEAFVSGLRAAHARQPFPVDEPARRLLQETQRRAAEARTRQESAEPEELVRFLRAAQASAGMQRTDSGLLVRVIMPGSGPRPRPQDTVIADFAAKMPDGTTPIPQLSGERMRLRLVDMPPGVVEGLQMLALGGHAIFLLPPRLSFGGGEWPAGLERGTPILLQVNLHDILPETSTP